MESYRLIRSRFMASSKILGEETGAVAKAAVEVKENVERRRMSDGSEEGDEAEELRG